MIFKPKNKKIEENTIRLYINDVEIKKVQFTKFLGVTIDDNMSWKQHVNNISVKISQTIGVLNRVKSDLPLHIRVQLYNTMILTHLSYCNIVWGDCANYLLLQLFRLQKRAIRIISNSSYLAHTHQLFCKLKILKIYDIHTLQTACFMFSYYMNKLPDTFDGYFITNRIITKYNTRNSDKLYIPFYRLNFSRTVISHSGPLVWNNLPPEIKQCPSINSFKRKCKSYLLNNHTS